MTSVFRSLYAAVLGMALVAPVSALQAQTPPPAAAAQTAQEKEKQEKERLEKERQEKERADALQAAKYEETVVVTASRASEKLVNAPATMSVVTSAQIEGASSPNFAELLRSVPGVNITQVSARDINVTTRGCHGHAGDRPARAARRPQPVPGLLRLRDVGPAAGQLQ